MSRPFIVIVMLALLATAALPVARPARAPQRNVQQGHVHGRGSAGAGASGANGANSAANAWAVDPRLVFEAPRG